MYLNSIKLHCGYTAIPYVVNGQVNTNLTAEELDKCNYTITSLKTECVDDRLSKNYIKELSLDQMVRYSVLWDDNENRPVMTTGAQKMSKNCCRLFSRYYLFKHYRTNSTETSMYDKVDNFEVDMLHLDLLKDEYPILFWSRDKGISFFKRIKKVRPDIFSDWNILENPIRLLRKHNVQGIIYTGTGKDNAEIYISELLFQE